MLEFSYDLAAGRGVWNRLNQPNHKPLGGLTMADGQLTAQRRGFQCKSCERELDANQFYVSNLSKCKSCVKADVRSNRAANAEYYRAYDRKRYRDSPERKAMARASAQTEAGQRSRAASAARIKAENPEKFKARSAVSNAIRDGRLARGSECYFCGAGDRLQAHHEDYDHPLDVVWLCAGCHGKLHTIKGDFRRASSGAQS